MIRIEVTTLGLKLARIVEKDNAFRTGDQLAMAEIESDKLLEDVMKEGGTIALGKKPTKFNPTVRQITKLSD